MSRSGYIDDGDQREVAMWRGWVESAFRSYAGRAFLREMIEALDAMPVKELIAEAIVEGDGGVCALGSVARRRGEMTIAELPLDPTDSAAVAAAFRLSEYIVRETAYENDEVRPQMQPIYGPLKPGLPAYFRPEETPAQRWQRMRAWAQDRLDRAETYVTRRTMRRIAKAIRD
jgi:hypothetical protein